VAVKFQRLGRISFRQTRRKRSYAAEHIGWLFQSQHAAEKEFQALKLAFACGVSVPEPLSQNRHAIVMGMIEGGELARWRELSDPKKVLKEVLLNVKRAFVKAGVVHADLSEYNIILKPNMRVLIIDWPQFVKADHPNSLELLTRDVKNVLEFFGRKYGVKAKLEDVLDYVKGKTRLLVL
jgi:RIO kinase 2